MENAKEDNGRGKIRSAFLNECFDYLATAKNLPDCMIHSDFRGESIFFSWFPKLEDCIASFNLDRSEWDFYTGGSREEYENFIVYVNDRQRFAVQQGDDDCFWHDLYLECGDEIGECFELVESITESKVDRLKYRSYAANTVVDEVLLLLPDETACIFRPQAIAAVCPDLLVPITVYRDEGVDGLFEKIGFSWFAWIEHLVQDGRLDTSQLPGIQPVQPDDLIYCEKDDTLCTVRKQRHTRNIDVGWWPAFIFRLKQDISLMYFWDFLRYHEEGEEFLKHLFNRVMDLPSYLKSIRLDMPSGRFSQIRRSVEFRTALASYRSEIALLQQVRVPAAEIVNLYRKRIEYVDFATSELTSEIDVLKRPLPFMIEWPYRRFRREVDSLTKIKYAQQLLNILAKLPVFLPLEEALAACGTGSSAWDLLQAEFSQKPTSDGSFVDLQERLLTLVSETRLKLPVFEALLTEISEFDRSHFMNVVSARNNFHHPPNDHDEFLIVCDAEFPSLIELFRRGLNHVEFLVPMSLRFADGQRRVAGKRIMGYDTEFETREFETEAEFERFPSGELVALNTRNHGVVTLKRFFEKRGVQSDSLDFGLFDKIQGGKTVYSYIRADTVGS